MDIDFFHVFILTIRIKSTILYFAFHYNLVHT